MTKNLCICWYGHCRSVALKRMFDGMKGHESLSVGCGVVSKETLAMLCSWADRIFILQANWIDWVPDENKHKVIHLDIGNGDGWSNPYNKDLATLLQQRYSEWEKSNGIVK